MPYSPTHKQQSHDRLVQAAAELFALHGFDAISIDQITAAAGMTRGAFYAHFRSKQALYAEAIMAATRHSAASRLLENQAAAPEQTARKVIESYLSAEHLALQFFPCPMAFLSTDIASRDQVIRDAYTQVFQGLRHIIEEGLAPGTAKNTEESDERRQRAHAITALMVGGMAISRALTDDTSKSDLIQACLDAALRLQEGNAST